MTTSQRVVTQTLLATMERGREYSISGLNELALQTIIPDNEDLSTLESGGGRWDRQIRNALRGFRNYDDPQTSAEIRSLIRHSGIEWNGITHSSRDSGPRYTLPLNSSQGVSASQEDELSEVEVPTISDGPPTTSTSNDGYAAEQYVANCLEAEGWLVVNVRNQGFGYDLHATRGDETRRIEVKSSSRGEVTPELTEREMIAAREYGSDFFLAVVDSWDAENENGTVSMFRDPANSLEASVVVRTSFRLTRDRTPDETF